MLAAYEDASFHSNTAVSRHFTSVMPYFSACGLEMILSGGQPGFGIGAMPASQLAQCHACTLLMAWARIMKDFG
jgi:hypothetical protein